MIMIINDLGYKYKKKILYNHSLLPLLDTLAYRLSITVTPG